MRVIAHLSDTHLNDDPDRHERFTRVVRSLQRAAPRMDAILFTGDVSDHGRVDEYQAAAQLLGEIDVPVLYCPGNHDQRQAFSQVLRVPGIQPGGFLNSRLDFDDLTVLALDSLIEGDDAGELHAETLQWLHHQLARTTAPVVLGLHHPPIEVGHPVVDAIKLANDHDLARIVAQHGNVITLLAGHAHTAAATHFAGKPLLLAPGIASTLRLPGKLPPEGHSLTESASPPGFALHFIDGSRVLTHFRAIDG